MLLVQNRANVNNAALKDILQNFNTFPYCALTLNFATLLFPCQDFWPCAWKEQEQNSSNFIHALYEWYSKAEWGKKKHGDETCPNRQLGKSYGKDLKNQCWNNLDCVMSRIAEKSMSNHNQTSWDKILFKWRYVSLFVYLYICSSSKWNITTIKLQRFGHPQNLNNVTSPLSNACKRCR